MERTSNVPTLAAPPVHNDQDPASPPPPTSLRVQSDTKSC